LSIPGRSRAYVRQIVDLSPGQRKRYLGQLQVLAGTRVRGSLKTKANYHGLIHGVFAYAVKCGYLAANPAIGTAPKQSRVKQSRPELRFLTERELETAGRLAGVHGDLLSVTVGTGPRFGEVSAICVGDVDLDHRIIRINKAWKLRVHQPHGPAAPQRRLLHPRLAQADEGARG